MVGTEQWHILLLRGLSSAIGGKRVFRLRIEGADEVVEAIAKFRLKLPYSRYEETELDHFLDFIDDKLSDFVSKLEDALQKLAEKELEDWTVQQYRKWRGQDDGS